MAEHVYTVSQISSYIKNMFTQDFALAKISVSGEISNCRYHTSGHIYFTLKDQGAVMSGVMFAGSRRGLSFRLEEGQHVIVRGNINIYERDGRYQIYAKEIVLAGEGELYQKFAQLKGRLAQMGMFDPMYKKPVPKYALKIGICTASTGAAIQDIINIASRRNPYVQLYLCPALVQGDMAAESIARGIRRLDQMKLDVLIVGRGGGSIEDLWAFNEETVARAIFSCRTPVISAVGHQTDTTIADYVADLRAPTPSAAAELAVFDYREFLQKANHLRTRLSRWMSRVFESKKMTVKQYTQRLLLQRPDVILATKRQYADDLRTRLDILIKNHIKDSRHQLDVLSERLNGCSPLKRIAGGYAYVTDSNGRHLQSAGQMREGMKIDLTMKDGTVSARVLEVTKESGV